MHSLTSEGHDASEDGTGRGTPIVAWGGAFHMTQDPISSETHTPCLGANAQVGVLYSIMPMNSGTDYKAREVEVTQPLMTAPTGGNQGGDYIVQPLAIRGREGGAELQAVREDTIVRRLTEMECERLQGYPPVLTWSEDMTKDEFIAAVLATGMVKADPETGKVWTLRGPGGILLNQPREITGSECNGYLVAKFTLGQFKRQVRLHRLIWIAANGIPDAGMAVCHRDDDKTNNRICNLYLATPEKNSTDAKESGRYKNGEDNPAAKISDELRQTICDDYRHSEATFRDLAEKYGISKSRVHQIVRQDGWTEGQTASARYRQLGNSVAVPCVEWIARRLIAVDEAAQ